MVEKIDNHVVNYVFSSKECVDALVDYLSANTGVEIAEGAKVALSLNQGNAGLILSVMTDQVEPHQEELH